MDWFLYDNGFRHERVNNDNQHKNNNWTGVVIINNRAGTALITTAQPHSTNPELKFCASNPARSVSKVERLDNGPDCK